MLGLMILPKSDNSPETELAFSSSPPYRRHKSGSGLEELAYFFLDAATGSVSMYARASGAGGPFLRAANPETASQIARPQSEHENFRHQGGHVHQTSPALLLLQTARLQRATGRRTQMALQSQANVKGKRYSRVPWPPSVVFLHLAVPPASIQLRALMSLRLLLAGGQEPLGHDGNSFCASVYKHGGRLSACAQTCWN